MAGGCATGLLAAEEWPRVIVRDGVTNTVHQPQLESWDYYTLKAESAVAIQAKGANEAAFGSIVFSAKTRVDRSERKVYFEKIEIESGNFPGAEDKGEKYLAALRAGITKEVKELSLDRVEASLAIMEARKKGAGPLKHDPPLILVFTNAAMLVQVDGTPIYRKVEYTAAERVFNTRALIVRETNGMHYLHLFDGYLQSETLAGPWAIAEEVPLDVKKVERLTVDAKQVDLLAGQENPKTKKKPSLKSKETPPPQIVVKSEPTELIVIKGIPVWAEIPSTQLLYMTNTAAHIFTHTGETNAYVLISGRWFRGPALNGPWSYVRSSELPKDFAAIPDDSPKENAKAAVQGTRQAQEAAIANDIPNMVKVERNTAKISSQPSFNSEPQMHEIEGTSALYAANSSTPVFKVHEAWYACDNGVWFTSASAHGPWKVTVSVPPEIYAIPPSSPMHYVVYSRVYNYDDDNISVGVTPGYYGTVVDEDGIVVYGTGYTYEPYVGETVYVSYPVTYGYGSTPCWTPWVGWSYGYGAAWPWTDDWYWWCYCPCAPYWGVYYGWCYGAYYNAYGGITAWGPYSWAGTSGYIYHQNGAWSGVSRAAAGYNAWTGNQWATQYGRAYNSTTGTRVVGQRGAVQNVYTGNYAYGGRGAFYNENSGVAGVGGKVTWGNSGTGNQGSAGRGTIYNPNTGNSTDIAAIRGQNGGAIGINGSVIVGNDGNYYYRGEGGNWQPVNRPGQGAAASAYANQRPDAGALAAQQRNTAQQQSQSAAAAARTQNLQREYNARQTGSMRQQSFQSNRPSFSGGGGRGGGGRGGGGGRRR